MDHNKIRLHNSRTCAVLLLLVFQFALMQDAAKILFSMLLQMLVLMKLWHQVRQLLICYNSVGCKQGGASTRSGGAFIVVAMDARRKFVAREEVIATCYTRVQNVWDVRTQVGVAKHVHVSRE